MFFLPDVLTIGFFFVLSLRQTLKFKNNENRMVNFANNSFSISSVQISG